MRPLPQARRQHLPLGRRVSRRDYVVSVLGKGEGVCLLDLCAERCLGGFLFWKGAMSRYSCSVMPSFYLRAVGERGFMIAIFRVVAVFMGSMLQCSRCRRARPLLLYSALCLSFPLLAIDNCRWFCVCAWCAHMASSKHVSVAGALQQGDNPYNRKPAYGGITKGRDCVLCAHVGWGDHVRQLDSA